MSVQPVVSPVTSAELPRCFVELLARYSGDDKPCLLVPRDPIGSDEHRAVSRAELSEQALRVAAALRTLECERGDRIAVLADNSPECVALFFGVWAAGLVAVPVAPSGLARRRAGQRSMLSIVMEHCRARFVVGRADALAREVHRGALAPDAPSRSFEQLIEHAPVDPSALPAWQPHELALIQYTSGTTSGARGVELTLGNLCANTGAIIDSLGMASRGVGLCWLPLFHDMGLIGTLLAALRAGMPLVLMTPLAFAARPAAWLWAISRFSVSVCAAPNAAYQVCAARVPQEQLHGLDLSSWQVAFNGAEQVLPETLDRFCTRFAPHGFRATAMRPVYGLAESAVAVTLGTPGAAPCFEWVDREALDAEGRARSCGEQSGRSLAALGRPLAGHALRIVSDVGEPLGEREVGSIEVRGPSVMRGYHCASEETARVLTADGFLRTGDRGFLLGGELFVVGREKHVVKHAGRSYDAADIASAVEELTGVVAGRVAVFGVTDDRTCSEGIVTVVGTSLDGESERSQLVLTVRRAIQAAIAVSPADVVLVRPEAIPRTSSGKVQHSIARTHYEQARRSVHA